MNAPTFSGAREEDPGEFLREIDKRFRVMDYTRPRRVEIAEFMLRGRAQSWCDLLRRSRSEGVVLSWEEF